MDLPMPVVPDDLSALDLGELLRGHPDRRRHPLR